MTTIKTTWEVWQHEVWGNPRAGYEVNDSHRTDRDLELRLRIEENNPGTDHAFQSAYPSDRQLRAALGVSRVRIETDGDDTTIEVSRARDGYPIGRLVCTSHDSLAPIRAKVPPTAPSAEDLELERKRAIAKIQAWIDRGDRIGGFVCEDLGSPRVGDRQLQPIDKPTADRYLETRAHITGSHWSYCLRQVFTETGAAVAWFYRETE